MRNPQHTIGGRHQRFVMGHCAWAALGEKTLVVGFTSYGVGPGHLQGVRHDLNTIPDQHPGFEFEELMDASGHKLAWVNLREARKSGGWLGGSFLARPIFFASEPAPWSEVLDALFFIHTQEPSRRVGASP